MSIESLKESASNVTYGASFLTTAVGTWAWIGTNATQIGALCAMGGLTVATSMFFVNWYYKHKRSK